MIKQNTQTDLFNDNFVQKISISQIIDYLRCPRYYKLVHKKKIKQFRISGEKIYIGTILHNVAAAYLRIPGKKSYDSLKIHFHNKFNKQKLKEINKKSDEEIEEIYNFYLDVLQKFHNQFNSYKTLVIEYSDSVEIDNYFIEGRLDCIVEDPLTHEPLLFDFKLNQVDLYEDRNELIYKNMQLFFYYLIIKKNCKTFENLMNIENLKLAFYYFNSNHMEKINFLTNIIEEGGEILKQLINEMFSRTEFPAQLCYNCSICGFRQKCNISSTSQ